jgi:hypothetical protein
MNSNIIGSFDRNHSKKIFKTIVKAREAVKQFANELHLTEP